MNRAAFPRHRTIITYGRFDLFDQDHVQFLRHLGGLGHELIVGCTTDALAHAQGNPCQMTYDARRAMLTHCRFVDRVIAEHDTAQKRTDIVNYNVAALIMGAEWQGLFDDLRDIADVLYIPRRTASESAVNWVPDAQFAVTG